MITLEICAQSFAAANAASAAGAHRIELCTDLPVGGLTPSYELIQKVCSAISIPVFVLIRPRSGHFYFSKKELIQIYTEIDMALSAGASGIVCGALTTKNKINKPALIQMIKHCADKPFTFHRAIEIIDDQYEALDLLIDLGVLRLLTGGSTGNAYASRFELKDLQDYASHRLHILAGSGVTSKNVNSIIIDGSLHEVHASAKYGSKALYHQDPNDSNPQEIKKILAALSQF